MRPAPLLRPSLAPRLLNPVLLPLGRLVEVALLAPLRLGVASVTSTAGGHDVTPNARCDGRFSVKTSAAAQCGPAAPTHHRMMMMRTTPTTMRCCFSAMPSWSGAAVPSVGARRALPCTHLPVRPGHFTIIQQDYPEVFEELTVLDLELEE